jgi:1-acyl-sn-glycerol-3-phosphate acyltransferase
MSITSKFQRYVPENRLYAVIRYYLKLIFVLCFRVRYFGIRNIPKEGGVLMVSNHQSHFDPPVVGTGCPRHMNFLARKTLFNFGPFGWLIGAVNAIPIDREGMGISGIKESLRHLKHGEMVLIFPEGTRSPDGEIKPFLPGFTSLATRSHSVILPAAIEGAYACWPKQQKFPHFGQIHVRYGRPILPEEYANLDDRELLTMVEERVRQCHAKLLEHPAFAGKK